MKTQRTITLKEHQKLHCNGSGDGTDLKIVKTEFDEIKDYVIRHSEDRGEWLMRIGHDYLKAQNHVGIIQTRRGTTVEILPKVNLARDNDQQSIQKKFF